MSTRIQVGSQYVRRVYGGVTDEPGRGSEGAQDVPETLQLSSTANARRTRGPVRNGHYSVHLRNVTASGAGSTFTVWYSDLPDPDETNDAHWVQDTNIAAIDLTLANTSTFLNLGNIEAEWIRFKPITLVSAGTMWMWVRAEGVQV